MASVCRTRAVSRGSYARNAFETAGSVGGCWVFEEGSSRNRVQLFKLSEEMTFFMVQMLKYPSFFFFSRSNTTCAFQWPSNEQFHELSSFPCLNVINASMYVWNTTWWRFRIIFQKGTICNRHQQFSACRSVLKHVWRPCCDMLSDWDRVAKKKRKKY